MNIGKISNPVAEMDAIHFVLCLRPSIGHGKGIGLHSLNNTNINSNSNNNTHTNTHVYARAHRPGYAYDFRAPIDPVYVDSQLRVLKVSALSMLNKAKFAQSMAFRTFCKRYITVSALSQQRKRKETANGKGKEKDKDKTLNPTLQLHPHPLAKTLYAKFKTGQRTFKDCEMIIDILTDDMHAMHVITTSNNTNDTNDIKNNKNSIIEIEKEKYDTSVIVDNIKEKPVGGRTMIFLPQSLWSVLERHKEEREDMYGPAATVIQKYSRCWVARSKYISIFGILDTWLLSYTGGILFHVECCISQLWCSSIMSYTITSIPHKHHTHIYPLLNI